MVPSVKAEKEEEEVGGTRDLEADKVQSTLQEVVTGFVTGQSFIDSGGRDRQALLREWKIDLATATECWKRIAVSSNNAARGQAKPLTASIDQATSTWNFMKAFAKFPNITFAWVEAAWRCLAQAMVTCPAKMFAKVVLKKFEILLVSQQLLSAARLLSISPPAGPDVCQDVQMFGMHSIQDPRTRDETVCGAAFRLSQMIFPYRLPPETTISDSKSRAWDIVSDIMLLELALPADVQDDLNTVTAMLKFEEGGSDRTSKAIEATSMAQSPKRTKNTFLSAFAVSKVGRSVMKDAAAFNKKQCQDVIAVSQVKQAATTCSDIAAVASGEFMAASFSGDFSAAIVVFVDAMDKVGSTLSPEDIATIGDTCEKIEKGLASALEARCGVLADGAEQDRNSEIQI